MTLGILFSLTINSLILFVSVELFSDCDKIFVLTSGAKPSRIKLASLLIEEISARLFFKIMFQQTGKTITRRPTSDMIYDEFFVLLGTAEPTRGLSPLVLVTSSQLV